MSVVTKENNHELYNALFPEDEIKEIDITKDLYLCSPLLNKDCSKENCYINNGCCCHTVNKKHSQQYLLDYITNLQEEKDKYKLRCYKAKKMIFDNYGVLDKYGIEMLEDILDGKSDE